MKCPTDIQIHRFREYVAINFNGINAETVYIPNAAMPQLVCALQDCFLDVVRKKASESGFKTVRFEVKERV